MKNNRRIAKPTATRRVWSIRTQLIVAVNVPLSLALAVLLALDYRREIEDAVRQKHASLEEEAMTIFEGLANLSETNRVEPIQQYIDRICAGMQESRSPGHHIAVGWNRRFLQAHAHRRASPEMLKAMQQAAKAPDHRTSLGDETLVVASFVGSKAEVYVSEYLTNIRRAIQREIALHLGTLAGLAIAAAVIINLVLWRMVANPVMEFSHTVGRIARGDYHVKTNGFQSRELNALSIAIQQMSKTLAANQRERQAQMDRARRIQENLLPNGDEIPGLDVALWFAPADDVAGDFYDLLPLSDGTWLICVADVTGHGVGAAMGAAMLKALLLEAVERYERPETVLKLMNRRLPALLPGDFASMFLGRWHPTTGMLDYASAGHEPGLLFSANREQCRLTSTGLPLGIDGEADWESVTVELTSGWRLLLATDGIAEASDPYGKQFGRERLSEIAVQSQGRSTDETIQLIRTAVLQHQASGRPMDDVTILLMESQVEYAESD